MCVELGGVQVSWRGARRWGGCGLHPGPPMGHLTLRSEAFALRPEAETCVEHSGGGEGERASRIGAGVAGTMEGRQRWAAGLLGQRGQVLGRPEGRWRLRPHVHSVGEPPSGPLFCRPGSGLATQTGLPGASPALAPPGLACPAGPCTPAGLALRGRTGHHPQPVLTGTH